MSGSSTRRPKTCPCSWTKCLEYKNELTDASDIASGYFRVVSAKQQSSNSKLHNLRRCIEHHLHINQQTISNNEECHVARHHWSHFYLEYHDLNKRMLTTPVSKQQAMQFGLVENVNEYRERIDEKKRKFSDGNKVYVASPVNTQSNVRSYVEHLKGMSSQSFRALDRNSSSTIEGESRDEINNTEMQGENTEFIASQVVTVQMNINQQSTMKNKVSIQTDKLYPCIGIPRLDKHTNDPYSFQIY